MRKNNKKNTGGAILDDAYNGAAQVGVFMGYVSLIISIIIGIILISIGVYLIFTKSSRTETAFGTVVNNECNYAATRGEISQEICMPVIKFVVNNVTYTKSIDLTTNKYYTGQTIDILYNPSNPYDCTIKTIFTRHTTGSLLLGIAAIILLIGIVHFYITRKYKFVAAASGIGTIVDIVD